MTALIRFVKVQITLYYLVCFCSSTVRTRVGIKVKENKKSPMIQMALIVIVRFLIMSSQINRPAYNNL